MATTLYAWANPLSLWKGADHTWVTTYPDPFSCPPTPDYWYCWGSCHPAGPGTTARLLASRVGDLALARCICAPNSKSAHGGINLYGIEGVCHQLTNRVLYATGPSPITVQGAHKYWLSHLLFGKYGTTTIDWAKRKQRCSVPKPKKVPISNLSQLDARIRKQLGTRYTQEVTTRLHALQIEVLAGKEILNEQVLAGLIDGKKFAEKVNALVESFVEKASEIVGLEDCAKIFDANPGEKVVIVDPEIAEKVRYTTKTE